MRIPLDRRRIVQNLRMLLDQVDKTGNCAGRLMLIKPKLEVHSHHGEILAAGAQLQIKMDLFPPFFFLRLEQAKTPPAGLRKISAGADEARALSGASRGQPPPR